MSVLSPAIIIFPVLFLIFSPVKKILLPKEVTVTDTQEIKSDTPIIFVIFDEFPLISLMDENHNIDPIRYPNFSALASESNWYRNYTINAPYTTSSIATTLTGKYTKEPHLLTSEEYPDNLFALLGGTYSIKAIESIGRMVPAGLNELDLDEEPLEERIISELLDYYEQH